MRVRLLAAVAIVLLAACSPAPRRDAKPDPAVSAAAPRQGAVWSPQLDTAARTYFDALAARRPEAMRAMLDVAEPASPAHTYAVVQGAGTSGKVGAGLAPERETVTYRDGRVRLCTPSDGDCLEFSDLRLGSSGRLATFKVGGNDLGARTFPGDGSTVERLGATFRLLGAYESVQYGGLLVVVEARAGGQAVDLGTAGATYQRPDGSAVDLSGALGPASLEPAQLAVVVLGFQGAGIGGRARLFVRSGGALDTLAFTIAPQSE